MYNIKHYFVFSEQEITLPFMLFSYEETMTSFNERQCRALIFLNYFKMCHSKLAI